MAGTKVAGTTFEIGTDGITYATLGCVVDWDLTKPSPTDIDTTCTTDTEAQSIKGIKPRATLAVSLNYDQDAAGRATAEASYEDDVDYYFRVTYSDAIVKTFTGRVKDISETGAVDDVIKAAYNIDVTSAIAEA